MRRAIAVALLTAAVAIAPAEGGERVPPVTDPVVKKECGSCHMAFPPQFLPRRSWQKLVDALADHFGENASLGEAPRKAVLDYLLANAADGPRAGRQGRKFVEGIPAAQTPLRITETPRWVKEHREVRAARWGDPKIKSKANCVACHTAAEQGLYED
jgi:cytochrome c551/c552